MFSSPADGSFTGKMSPRDIWLWKSVTRRTGGLWETKTLLLKGHIQTHLLQVLAQRQKLEKHPGHMRSHRRILKRVLEKQRLSGTFSGVKGTGRRHFFPQLI